MTTPILFTLIIFYSFVLFIPIALFVLYKRPAWWQYLFALFLGLITAWLDHGASEVQGTALLLIVFGMFIGFAQPKQAWLSALLIGVWIPLTATVRVVAGLEPFQTGQTVGSLLALGLAFAGTYVGVAVNHFSPRVQQPNERKIQS